MAFCSNCGHPLPEGTKFCTECGAPVSAAQPTPDPAPAAQPAPEESSAFPFEPAAPAPSVPAGETAPQPTFTARPAPSAGDTANGSAPNGPVTPPPAAPAGGAYFTPAPIPGAKAPRREGGRKTGLIIGIAAGAVLAVAAVVVLIVTLGGRKTTAPAPKSALAAAPAETEAPDTGSLSDLIRPDLTEPQEPAAIAPAAATPAAPAPTQTPAETDAATEDFAALLNAYKSVVDSIIGETTDTGYASEHNCGYLWDYDGDSYPEMVLLYSRDGTELHALIARRTDDSRTPRCMDILLCYLAGGADGAIASGTLDGEPVLHLLYNNFDGDGQQVGTDYVFSLANTDITQLYELEWTADSEGYIQTCSVMSPDGSVQSTDTDEFMRIYGAMEYYEADYNKTELGIALADMFSDEAMQEYFR